MLSSVLVIVPFLAGTFAANDWSTPCVTGQCSYDLPATDGPSGTMKIWGSENAITDITPAAHWQILDCDPKALSQNIRLVCTNDDPTSSLCGHLYQNGGAVNKIVRLPEACGANAFARVSKSWVSDDQSIPASLQARVVRRDGSQPTVKAVAIDTDFDAVDWSNAGKVNIAIQGGITQGTPTTPVPGSRRAPTITQAPGSRRGSRRGFFHSIFSKAESAVTNAESEITSVAGKITSDAASLVTKAASAVKSAASSAESAINHAVPLDKTETLAPSKPLTFEGKHNIFNTSADCGAVSTSLSVDVDGNANIQPSIALTINGTLAPLEFTAFKAVSTLTAQLEATLTVSADLTGHLESTIELFSIGIPGFDFPGVLEVGPTFTVDGQITGDVDLAMDLVVGINFNANNAQLTFPSDDASNSDSNAFSIGDTPLQLSASPSVKATGTLGVHLIPKINIGLKAIGGKADATVFLAFDTSAELVLSLDASAGITKTIGDNSTASASAAASSAEATSADSTADASSIDATATTASVDPGAVASSVDATATAASANPADTAAVAAKRDGATTSGSFGGCVQVNAGIDINAGAEGEFFSLLKDVAQVSLFKKKFQLFKKCFGDGTTTTIPTRRAMRRVPLYRRGLFSCPAAGTSAPEPVTSGTVSSPNITPA
ncbi:hypothetical protein DFH08DRAFT_854328 [Mycena albidolilacea]|uniref:DUF7223 domain-containing protein n=1 Tax=Mycena albidolilacea TaxID=1033008 RepID=A0AAD7EVY2_9AGAR|nr:hypothetical protein DFH08DRAFT_854328 [Mycena albidolilacea]